MATSQEQAEKARTRELRREGLQRLARDQEAARVRSPERRAELQAKVRSLLHGK